MTFYLRLWRKFPFWLLLLSLAIAGQGGCFSRSTEQAIIEYLSDVYEQPWNNMWFEGKVYFLPEKPGLKLLAGDKLGTNLEGLEVYEASVWMVHLAPEEFPILVWVVKRGGKLQLGVLEDSAEVATKFPGVLKDYRFATPKTRRDLALLLGEMVGVFESKHAPGKLVLTSEGNCEWVARVGSVPGGGRRIAAACFSNKGSLEGIIYNTRRLQHHKK